MHLLSYLSIYPWLSEDPQGAGRPCGAEGGPLVSQEKPCISREVCFAWFGRRGKLQELRKGHENISIFVVSVLPVLRCSVADIIHFAVLLSHKGRIIISSHFLCQRLVLPRSPPRVTLPL